jgi:hypothetical protein
VEPVMHFSVIVFYFGTAVIASALGYMNPTNIAVCWIVPYPLYCAYERFHSLCSWSQFQGCHLVDDAGAVLCFRNRHFGVLGVSGSLCLEAADDCAAATL